MIQVNTSIMHESFKLTSGEKISYTQKHIAIFACRNDWAAFSILVQASEYAVLLKRDRAYFTEKGSWPIIRVEAACPDIGPVKVYTAGQFMCEDDISRADILLEDDTAELRPWMPQQLFCQLEVPDKTAAGTYKGRIKIYLHQMFEDERLIEEMQFTLQVYPVTLPADRRFFLNLWQHPANIARKHEVDLFSDEHFVHLEEYIKSLRVLGNKVATLIVSEVPWSGQACFQDYYYRSDLFEYNYIRVCKKTDGTFAYDYSVIERYINLCDKYGVAEEIGIFGLIRIWQNPESGYGYLADDYPDAIRICYKDLADGTLRYMRRGDDIRDYIRSFHNWLQAKGWLERSVIIADEPPDMEQFRKSLSELRKAGPGFKIQVDVPPAMYMEIMDQDVYNYTPLISDPAEQPELFRKIKEKIKGRVQLSVCCYPSFPNQFLSSPLLETHLMAYLSQFLEVDGFLRWNYTVWPDDPRSQMIYKPGNWESGDTCFVYPSRGGRCLLSLRYYALKRCTDIFELLCLVKDQCAQSKKIMQQVYDLIIKEQDFTRWTFGYDDDRTRMYSLNYANYDAARKILVEALAANQEE